MNTTSSHSTDDTIPSVPSSGSAKPANKVSPNAFQWLALGAIAGPVLFTLGWIILGALSPGYTAWGIHIAPYSPISQPISGLGVTAPFMNAIFVLSGFLLLVGVIGIFQGIREMGAFERWSCIVLFAFSPLGMVMDGFFTLETILLHTVGFLLACATPILSFVVVGITLRRIKSFRRFGNWLLLGSPLTLALLILYFLTFSPTVAGLQTGVAGLTERTLGVEVHIWFVVLGVLVFQRLSGKQARDLKKFG
ncbi:hypothetical protein KSF_004810 [Reticulibacter mediterranei]|uniref:DUF998 domain-containing protein n=1 Tax=Reticulibacter mediterranei TaxID=2778369 RepID=A0A8J3ID98_9CHLR|nr:DUF998 domain-containing protein [Reticulibacter mediterranei]GHO90433.1 hypothetical protein KSF_004810 [Reticulibacter mediterranei]